ncbi:unnamed protein product [Brachionus calyciflorus]|uniref:Uncharacterized protein n=1 Tax=Brachionus calyciflorus TaxID=104777 RepID=A0A814F638_9BILA|nr:unnamed protein product [Brachionus calyciflorus]
MHEQDLKCSYCQEIFKTLPTTLSPCGWVICSHHINFAEIFCPICPDNHIVLRKNCLTTKNIEIKYLKYNVKDSLEKLDVKLEDMNQIKKDPEHYVNEFFGELINKIDIQRERVKLLVDNHFDEILKKAKASQSECQNRVKSNKNFNDFEYKEFKKKVETFQKTISENQISIESLTNFKNCQADIEKCFSYINELKDSLTDSKIFNITPIKYPIDNDDLFGKLLVSDKKIAENTSQDNFINEGLKPTYSHQINQRKVIKAKRHPTTH